MTSAAPAASAAPLPGLATQKRFIVANGELVDPETARAILRTVREDLGEEAAVTGARPVLVERTGRAPGVFVHLDRIDSPALVAHIYNIVRRRRRALNEPAP
jgi:hypothetical protein